MPCRSFSEGAFNAKWVLIPRSRSDILFQPREQLSMPQDRVLRFEDRVVLIGKIDEPGRYALEAQRVVIFQALRQWHAEIALAVRDQRRRLEVLGEALGRLLVDDGEVAPRPNA